MRNSHDVPRSKPIYYLQINFLLFIHLREYGGIRDRRVPVWLIHFERC